MRMCLFIFIAHCALGQDGLFINGSAAAFRVGAASFVSVKGDFGNLNCDPVLQVRFNGALYVTGNLVSNDTTKFAAVTQASKSCRLIFRSQVTHTWAAVITGSCTPQLWEVEVDRPGGIVLMSNVKSRDTVAFLNGNIYMNGYTWDIDDPVGAPLVLPHPYIKNERHNSCFTAATLNDTGMVRYATVFSQSVNINPANIGFELRGLLDIGSALMIRRGFLPQVNAGNGSVLRYFDIYSPGYSLDADTIIIRHNGTDERLYPSGHFSSSAMRPFFSAVTDNNWSQLKNVAQLYAVTNTVSPGNGALSVPLAGLLSPNVNVSPNLFRITVAGAMCADPPSRLLSGDTLHICAGGTATLDAGNNSHVSNTSLRWEWSTQPVRYSQSFTVAPASSVQQFAVRLTDVRGCESADSIYVGPAAPYPQIRYLNHLNACVGDSITVRDTVQITTGTFTNTYMFSDQSSSHDQRNQFRFLLAAPGTYAMLLTSVSRYSCVSTATIGNIIVYPQPVASYTSSHNCANVSETFTSTSASGHSLAAVSLHQWNIGGNISAAANPVQTLTPGIHTVQLIAFTNFGCSDTALGTIFVPALNKASFSSGNSCVGDTSVLVNTSTCSTGNCTYVWETGDGAVLQQFNVSKIYVSPGTYPVKLKAEALQACPDSAIALIVIHERPVPMFTASSYSVCEGSVIYFTNTSSIAAGAIASYSWVFGNNVQSTATHGSHKYLTSGMQQLTLTAASDSGCVSQHSHTVTVHQKPVAGFTTSAACLGDATKFFYNGTGKVVTLDWDYGDGVVDVRNDQIAVHTYSGAGVHTAQLKVLTNYGCSDTVTALVQVLPLPPVSVGGQVSTCGSSLVIDAGQGQSQYKWLPGGQQTHSCLVTIPGNYSVHVTAVNGCTRSAQVAAILNDAVIPDLGRDTAVCGVYRLDAGYSGAQFLWSNGSTSQMITATQSGPYSVKITDQNNCTGSDTVIVTLRTPAVLDLGRDTVMCASEKGFQIALPAGQTYMSSAGPESQYFIITRTGYHWLKAAMANGCSTTDTIKVSFLKVPHVSLGNDTSVCGGLTLNAKNKGCTYLWHNSTSAQELIVDATVPAFVTVHDPGSGCNSGDTVLITVNAYPSVDLGKDTVYCGAQGVLLIAGDSTNTYNWTNRSAANSIRATGNGIYGVTVTTAAGCSARDFVSVSKTLLPEFRFAQQVQFLCGEKPVLLSAPLQTPVTWSVRNSTIGKWDQLQVAQEGIYFASITMLGCELLDSVRVEKTSNTVVASFLASTSDTVNKPVQLVNLSEPFPLECHWDFGDGFISTDPQPLHTFVSPGTSSVTLEVSNGYCTDRVSKSLQLLFRKRGKTEEDSVHAVTWTVYPNPFSQSINYNADFPAPVSATVQVHDVTGKLVALKQSRELERLSGTIDLRHLPSGMYIFSLYSDGRFLHGSRHLRIIKAE